MLANTPVVSWVPFDKNRALRVLRVLARSRRAARGCTFAYTTRALPALGALLGGAPAVYLEFHMPPGTKSDRAAFALARRSPRLRIVCISRRLAEIIAAKYALDASAFIVEHSGHGFPVGDEYVPGPASRRLVATYVGTFAPGRGLEMVLGLAKRHPQVDFVLVGPGDMPAGPVPANVSVRRPVAHSAVPALLAASDVLLMPYTRHAMLPNGDGGTAEYCSPLKMVEYLAAGRSIISSNLPSISEIMIDGRNCLLATPESIEEWSAAMALLESDSELRVRLSRGAAQTARHHTTFNRVQRIFGPPAL
jgi:glycosyltransferase involved in cell wall biosynthesis